MTVVVVLCCIVKLDSLVKFTPFKSRGITYNGAEVWSLQYEDIDDKSVYDMTQGQF
jgi:hypothetical protein